ncbi:TetR/AcrR family transcriptional regulator [Ectopseudomonas alcaliphila]|uniref:TetR/AcrR family transcriptional regulator n=1 Tax=Ectopseudomonas alcaliphila TaxID=101564 RepID=UPI002784DF52|nr:MULTISPECIES: TetR/AcrR family transcriptional regulator [Pseudomonas]MDP9938858.1 AcrR family transcriptional regulator [Pseudomonas sp. 3400]MDR7011081.1 AcrR family transcriptional regulator [Pseudomonas alcaliphila]
MNIDEKLISTAEALFDCHGFNATGMDRLAQAAGMSSRTLYKHAGSKNELIAAVLMTRGQRFLLRLELDSVEALFDALARWMSEEGARGCLFLRAQGEIGSAVPEVAEAVTAYKARFSETVRRILVRQLGAGPDEELVEQVVILFEGATAAASYRGVAVVATAGRAATLLVERARA